MGNDCNVLFTGPVKLDDLRRNAMYRDYLARLGYNGKKPGRDKGVPCTKVKETGGSNAR